MPRPWVEVVGTPAGGTVVCLPGWLLALLAVLLAGAGAFRQWRRSRP